MATRKAPAEKTYVATRTVSGSVDGFCFAVKKDEVIKPGTQLFAVLQRLGDIKEKTDPDEKPPADTKQDPTKEGTDQ